MRLLISLALAVSAVVAFNEPFKDTVVMLAHQGVQMDSVVDDLRVLKGGKHGTTRRLAVAHKMSGTGESRVRRPSKPSLMGRVNQAASKLKFDGGAARARVAMSKIGDAAKSIVSKGRQRFRRKQPTGGIGGIHHLGGF
ncbi:hypothetical protein AC1031_011462 [Aphanomyces cochlioides]|nr:hypothetical protein AC1031_011462 [Aphanomyces cochlioides]